MITMSWWDDKDVGDDHGNSNDDKDDDVVDYNEDDNDLLDGEHTCCDVSAGSVGFAFSLFIQSTPKLDKRLCNLDPVITWEFQLSLGCFYCQFLLDFNANSCIVKHMNFALIRDNAIEWVSREWVTRAVVNL